MLKAIVILSLVALAAFSVINAEKVDVDDADVQAAAKEAARALSKKFSEKHHHILLKVQKARKLYSNTYQLDIILGLTTCLKSEVEFDQADDCELKQSISTYKKCTVGVTKDGEKFQLRTSGCILGTKNDL